MLFDEGWFGGGASQPWGGEAGRHLLRWGKNGPSLTVRVVCALFPPSKFVHIRLTCPHRHDMKLLYQYSRMTLFAHSLPHSPPSEWQTLPDHAASVADMGTAFESPFWLRLVHSLFGGAHPKKELNFSSNYTISPNVSI